MITWGLFGIAWRNSLKIDHGHHPSYEYWGIGPIEFRKFNQGGEFLSLELERPAKGGKCYKCGEAITPENDSRWYENTESGWQPICTGCYEPPEEFCFRCEGRLTEDDIDKKFFVLDGERVEKFCATCRFTRHHWMAEMGIKTMEKL